MSSIVGVSQLLCKMYPFFFRENGCHILLNKDRKCRKYCIISERQTTLDIIKTLFSTEPILKCPDYSLQLAIRTDANSTTIIILTN